MEPLLLDIRDRFDTERLSLRVPRAGDGAIIGQAVTESLGELQPWMPWAQGTPPVENYEIFARKAVVSFAAREQIHMLVFLRGSDELVGSCGMNNIDWKVPHGQIGYWLRTSRTGRGYMTEAVIGWTQFAFAIGMKRLEIRCDTRNHHSVAVAERAGYELEGVFRHDSRDPGGALRDTKIFSRIVPEIG